MKTYKSLIVSSLMVAIIMSVPVVSMANNGQKNDRNNRFNIGQYFSQKQGENSNSLFNRMFKLFGDKNNVEVNNLAPSISGIKAPTVLKIGETGTWTIKATDPKNGSLEYAVNWGDTTSKALSKTASPLFVQDTTFTHAYSEKGIYNITFTVSNEAGLKATSTVSVHVVGQVSTTMPVISNLMAKSTRPHKAIITWQTDVKANSLVWYSKTSPVNTSGKANISRKASILNHKIELSKLESNIKYYVVVGSANKEGTTMSSETSFTTPAKDNTAPVITSLKGPSTIMTGETITVTVNAYDPKNGTLSYTADWGDNVATTRSLVARPFVQSATFSHIYNSIGTYTATFTAENSAGQKTSSSMKINVTSSDTTAPVISDIKAITDNSTSTITWTTNEPSTSEILYSINTPVDENSSSTDGIADELLVTNHSIEITDLTANTLYHFVIKSTDNANNTVTSSESTFATTN